MSDYFIPLGGGNEIGASAYYLSIEGIHIPFGLRSQAERR